MVIITKLLCHCYIHSTLWSCFQLFSRGENEYVRNEAHEIVQTRLQCNNECAIQTRYGAITRGITNQTNSEKTERQGKDCGDRR
jgi:hypothetical protein